MICFVYRSTVKDEMYLYIKQRDNFCDVPDALLKRFGKPEFALQLNLAKRSKLAREDIDSVKQQLEQQGYFLQMPPQLVNELSESLKHTK
ncbi:MAG: YcgL domain-containing protein [Kangiellaceae bacterium]|jgi:uncharacterized protein YcgL (UPF0745 family)|nr:YcgL domain-containing protein [Kangiellaceae bacterium]